ncbi:MAG: polymerase subunit sigma-70 [Frankiales bacterium]|nr:polymerase subunit sigma-70 [Frankiales bacterium]
MNDPLLDDLLPPAQAGEAWALTALYEQLAPKVAAYLRARGASEPEDLTSEVFLTVFPKLATLTGGAAGLRTFTFSVAHARLVDDLRRRGRREPTVPYEPAGDPRTSPSGEDEAVTNLQAERVRALLDRLLPDQRDVLVMRILGDLSIEQVAQALGRSEGAVKQLQRRGPLALRAALENNPDGVTL